MYSISRTSSQCLSSTFNHFTTPKHYKQYGARAFSINRNKNNPLFFRQSIPQNHSFSTGQKRHFCVKFLIYASVVCIPPSAIAYFCRQDRTIKITALVAIAFFIALGIFDAVNCKDSDALLETKNIICKKD